MILWYWVSVSLISYDIIIFLCVGKPRDPLMVPSWCRLHEIQRIDSHGLYDIPLDYSHVKLWFMDYRNQREEKLFVYIYIYTYRHIHTHSVYVSIVYIYCTYRSMYMYSIHSIHMIKRYKTISIYTLHTHPILSYLTAGSWRWSLADFLASRWWSLGWIQAGTSIKHGGFFSIWIIECMSIYYIHLYICII